jgi:pimeloyl-ACP methyl ester carboxylesterase
VDLATLSAGAVVGEDTVTFPGARPPDRRRTVRVEGLGLAVYEWGDPDGRPIALLHGGFDFGRTFDVFAPLLADAGYRVVTWDHRNHGDSDRAELTSMSADMRDAIAVIDSITSAPMAILGHSKGGGMALRLVDGFPHRFTHVVNIDGMPGPKRHLDVADHERGRLTAADVTDWLDRRRVGATAVRRPGTLQELARRRAATNPRLSFEWLCYLVTVGARRDPDGWRWKIDAAMRPGGFGPWRPEWMRDAMPGIALPFLAMIGYQIEPFGWGLRADDLLPYLPPQGRLEVFPDVGHFVHIERPGEVAQLVLEFLS